HPPLHPFPTRRSSDLGGITLNGTIDASGAAGGGRVELDAANTLSLAGGGKILANGTSTGTSATDPYSNGGLVRLSSASTAPGVRSEEHTSELQSLTNI